MHPRHLEKCAPYVLSNGFGPLSRSSTRLCDTFWATLLLGFGILAIHDIKYCLRNDVPYQI
jgi:hypothetical protein